MTSRIEYNNPKSSGVFGLPYHYEMVSDNKRVDPFAKALKKICKGKRVLESGTGSGILSLLAARAGASRVYAVEKDTQVFRFAEQNILKSGFADRIKLINKDITKTTLKDIDGERVDVVVAENLSTWQVTEPQIPILNYINENLANPKSLRVPARIDNCLELVNAKFRFQNLVTIRTQYFEFTGIKKAKNLSGKIVFNTVSLSCVNELTVQKTIKIKVSSAGILNAVRLTSPVTVQRGVIFKSSDSLMPPIIMPLESDIKVKMGDIIKIEITYQYNTGWDSFVMKAQKEEEK